MLVPGTWEDAYRGSCLSLESGKIHTMAHACPLNLGRCSTSATFDVALEAKGINKICEKGCNVDCGFKCVCCCRDEWDLVEKEMHVDKRNLSFRDLSRKVSMSQSAWKVHRSSHQRKPHFFQCTVYLLSLENTIAEIFL